MVLVDCSRHSVDMGHYGNYPHFTINVIKNFKNREKQVEAWDNPLETVNVSGIEKALQKVVELCEKYS